jgi:hypothetical protein
MYCGHHVLVRWRQTTSDQRTHPRQRTGVRKMSHIQFTVWFTCDEESTTIQPQMTVPLLRLVLAFLLVAPVTLDSRQTTDLSSPMHGGQARQATTSELFHFSNAACAAMPHLQTFQQTRRKRQQQMPTNVSEQDPKAL